jgi:xanthine dehydrogenase YagR molybdenum-binding subunit
MPTSAPAEQAGQDVKVVGTPIDRVDGRAKVTGQARYAADFPSTNLAYAVAFQSSIARGRVQSIDAAVARRQSGVLAIITHENAPPLHRVSMDHQEGKPGQTYLPLQDDQIHYAGQYLGMVVANSFTAARDAAMLINISYEPQPPTLRIEDAIDQAFAPTKMGRSEKPVYQRGNPDAALSAAPIQLTQTYTTPIENHNPMELSATLASWNGDKLTLYNATQFVYGSRSIVSTWLGISQDDVRVIDPFVGGGFGCKGSAWPHEVMAAIAAKMVGRPVKLVLSRRQMFTCVGYRSRTIQRISLAAEKDGRLTAIIHDCTSQAPPWKDQWAEPATTPTRMLYACPNLRTSQKLVPVNANTPTQMRAPGLATGTFALEVAMDELAAAAGIDPVELRLINYAEKDPGTGLPWSSKALRECYEQGAARFGWRERNPKIASMRDGERLVGYGMATATYPTNQQEATAKAEIRSDGAATISTAAHDLGTGAYTILSQVASDALGIPVEQIQVKLGDSRLPNAPGAGGSQTSASAGSAVLAACRKAQAALKERAIADSQSPFFQKQSKSIRVSMGKIEMADDASISETISALLQRNGGRPVSATATVGPPSKPGDSDQPPTDPENIERYSKHAWGAQFAEVQIDPTLRELRVTRLLGAFAAGKILNPKTARSQIIGAMVWGLGMGLLEQTVYDPQRGQVVTDSLADYMVPVNADIHSIDCFFVEEIDTMVNPLGVKGIGEIGITGVAAAISNAVFHATGRRIRDLPITLDKIL